MRSNVGYRARVSDSSTTPAPGSASQTLERGLRILEVLAGAPEGMSVTELSRALDTHRAGIYRLLRPLLDHRLVDRAGASRYRLGLGLTELASKVRPRLQQVASPELQRLADELGATVALTVREDREAVVLLVLEPRNADLHIAYRAGLRHRIDVAAPGIAILAANPPVQGERPEVAETRRRGWARSSGELLTGATGVGVAITTGRNEPDAAISAVWISERDDEAVARTLLRTARVLSDSLR